MPSSIKPKYRVLANSELQELEKDFIQFLAIQGIPAELWVEYLQSDPDKISDLITQFSDLVLGTIYQKCRLIEQLTKNGWLFYHFDDQSDLIRLHGVVLSKDCPIDMRDLDKAKATEWMQTLPEGTFQLVSAEKKMTRSKPEEVDQLIRSGGFLSDNNEMYAALRSLYEDQ